MTSNQELVFVGIAGKVVRKIAGQVHCKGDVALFNRFLQPFLASQKQQST